MDREQVLTQTSPAGLANTGTYTWTPDSSIPSGSQYALQITDDGNPDVTNYSGQFGISSDTSAPSDASSAAASFETGKGLTNTDSVSIKSTAAASSGTDTGSGSVTGSETGSASGSGSGSRSGSGSGSATETGSGSTGGSLTATGTGSSGSLTASITGTQRAQETSTSGGSSAESSGSSSEKESATGGGGSGGSKTTSSSRSSSSSSAKPSETKNAAPNSGLQLSGGLLAMVGALMAAL